MIESHKKTIYEALGRDPVHPFPARMAPGIAFQVISDGQAPLRVLDPMMGSGTVVALARAMGHRSVGVDIDPLAVLISRVWTTAIDTDELRQMAKEVLRRAKASFDSLPVREAYPLKADEETCEFVRYWFDGYARRQLAALSGAIQRVDSKTLRDALWCGFSRLIITKQSGASLAMDLAHSRPHKKFDSAPTKPFNKFLQSIERVADNCISHRDIGRGHRPVLHLGDARKLPIEKNSIDLVLSSPPYLNAIDYMRCSKFSLIWMGYSIEALRKLRSTSVGSEASNSLFATDRQIKEIIGSLNLRPKLQPSQEAILTRYVGDIQQSLTEASRVLDVGGKAIYVIGESTVRGTYIRNSKILSEAADRAGLRLIDRRTRMLPANRRYLPPPSSDKGSQTLNSRLRREVVLAFEK